LAFQSLYLKEVI